MSEFCSSCDFGMLCLRARLFLGGDWLRDRRWFLILVGNLIVVRPDFMLFLWSDFALLIVGFTMLYHSSSSVADSCSFSSSVTGNMLFLSCADIECLCLYAARTIVTALVRCWCVSRLLIFV